MKIIFHHRIASRDGQAVHMEELIGSFRRLGHEVFVVGPALSSDTEVGKQSALIKDMKKKLPKSIYEIFEFLYAYYALIRIKRSFDKFKPDVIYERYNLFMPAGVWLKKWVGVPLFLEVNSPLFDERLRYDGLSLRRFAKWIEDITWRGADRVLPVTDVLAGYVKQGGVPTNRISVIPNGIDRERFLRNVDAEAAKARLGLSGSIVLGFTGFIRSWHGLQMVLEFLAAEHNPRLKLLVVGDGPGRPELEEMARTLAIEDSVRFVGAVHHDDIVDHVAAFDVALQPSVTPYASPLKLFEYLALEKATVAPRMPNIEEILVDGETALLFAPGDQQSFSTQTSKLCNDEQLRARIGSAGRRLVEERDLTWDGNARRIVAMFEEALGSRDTPR